MIVGVVDALVVVVPAALMPVTALTTEPTVFREFTRLVRLPIADALPELPMPNPCRAVVKPPRPARGLASKRADRSKVSWFPMLLVDVAVEAVELVVD